MFRGGGIKGAFTIFPTAFQVLHKFMPSVRTFLLHSYLISKNSDDFENVKKKKKMDSVTPTPEFLQDKQHAKKLLTHWSRVMHICISN